MPSVLPKENTLDINPNTIFTTHRIKSIEITNVAVEYTPESCCCKGSNSFRYVERFIVLIKIFIFKLNGYFNILRLLEYSKSNLIVFINLKKSNNSNEPKDEIRGKRQ